MSSCRTRDIPEGWGGNGCSEGFGGLKISTETVIEGWDDIEGDSGLDIDGGTSI